MSILKLMRKSRDALWISGAPEVSVVLYLWSILVGAAGVMQIALVEARVWPHWSLYLFICGAVVSGAVVTWLGVRIVRLRRN